MSGTGKTRLASVLARKAAKQGFTVLAGAVHRSAGQAYQPVARGDRMAQPRRPNCCLRAGLDEQCGPLARLAPSLTAPPLALSVPPAADPVADRYQMLASLRALVRRLAEVRPVLFVLDDLHWATPESIEMVRALSHDTEGMALRSWPSPGRSRRIRPGDRARLRKLEAEPASPSAALSQQDVAPALAAPGPGAPGVAAARLHAITGGNAFLVTEMIRTCRTALTSETWQVPKRSASSWPARMAQLSPAARELVNLLGVGEQLAPAVLSLAMGVTGGRLRDRGRGGDGGRPVAARLPAALASSPTSSPGPRCARRCRRRGPGCCTAWWPTRCAPRTRR